MRFKNILHIISLLIAINIATNISSISSSNPAKNKLSPASILKNDSIEQKIFTTSENKKIEHIKSLLSKNELNFEKFIALLNKNNPKLTEEALNRYIKSTKSQKLITDHINKAFNEKNITNQTYTKLLNPFFKNLHLLELNSDFYTNISILLKKTDQSQNIKQEFKNQIIKNIIIVSSKPKTQTETESVVNNILAPIALMPEYSEILTNNIFPPRYKNSNIHTKLSYLSDTIRKDILTYIISPKTTDIDLRKTTLRLLQETQDTEKENKIIDFLNKNYNEINRILKFFKQKDIKMPQSFLDFIIRRRQTSLLKPLYPSFDNSNYTNLLKKLMDIQYTQNKKHNTIKDNLINIYDIFSFDQGKTSVQQETLDLLAIAIDDFGKNITGNKKFSEKIRNIQKNALYVPVIKTITEMILPDKKDSENANAIENKIIKIMDTNPNIYNYLLNLCDIYNRIARIFPTTGSYIRETIQHLLDYNGDLKKLNKWLYTESPWNKEAYTKLLDKGFSTSLWENSISQTYFADSKTTKKMQNLVAQIKKLKSDKNLSPQKKNQLNFLSEELARLKKEEPKIIVELEFDFLKDSYSGIALHDSISPNKRFEVAPLATALETNTVFMHVYKENSTTPFSSILLALTPNGLVDMGFPTDSPNLDHPVFDTIAQLLKNDTIPAVNINSKKTSYVASATYNFAAENKMLKTEKKESIKKEPWNLSTSFDPKNPRHYPFGKNVLIDGVQHGVFKTSFTINKDSIKKYNNSISIENIEKELNIDTEKHLYSDFLNDLRQKVLTNAEKQNNSKQYIQKTLPALSILKEYMQKHNLLPERLYKHRAQLKKIIPQELLAVIDDKTKQNNFSLNIFFSNLFSKKQAQHIIPASA